MKAKPYTQAEKAQYRAERQEKMDTIAEQLETEVLALQSTENFRRYLETAAMFHGYSFNNVMLIACQRPDATRVAGYRTWQKLGRQVKKGETGIRILAPMPFDKVVRDQATGEEIEKHSIRFTTTSVFDISQTEGEPLPDIAPKVLQGEGNEEAYQFLVRFAQEELGITVTYRDDRIIGSEIESSYLGYYRRADSVIYIKENPPKQMIKTLLHELGHALDEKLTETEREEKEVVAETTAFIVATYLGIDTASYSVPYIAGWAAQEDASKLIRQILERAQRSAARLIDTIERAPAVSDEEETAA